MSQSGEGTRDPDALIARAGIRGDPRCDQHFLVDNRVLDRLPEYATGFDLTSVLEVGPGPGGLTDRLLAVSDHVTAVERDPNLVSFLRSEFREAIGDARLSIIRGDALDVDLPDYSTCISNLPYGISSELLFRLLPRDQPLVVTVQREFAERMTAEPGTPEYGRLSVTAGHYASAEIVEIIPAEAFQPQPAVESAVVRSTPKAPPYTVDEGAFLDFVRAVFTQRRKTMRNAIRNTTHISGIDDPVALITTADSSLMAARPGDLTPQDFAMLVELSDNGRQT